MEVFSFGENVFSRDLNEFEPLFCDHFLSLCSFFFELQDLGSIEFLAEAIKEVPGLEKESAYLQFSFYSHGTNFLIYKGESGSFVVFQNTKFFHGLIYPHEKLVIINSPKEFHAEKILMGYDEAIVFDGVDKFSPNVFLGVLNGYSRPYHYFYDKGPVIFDWLKRSSAAVNVVSTYRGAFLPGSSYSSKVNEIVVSEEELRSGGERYFILAPAVRNAYSKSGSSTFHVDLA